MRNNNKYNSNPYRTNLHISSPLNVWIISVSIVLILLLISIPFFIKYLKMEDDQFIKENIARIEFFSKKNRKNNTTLKSVIVFGSSLLYRSTFYDEDMENFSRKFGFNNLSFMRIARYNADIFHFTPLLNNILSTSPNLLMIQSDLLLYFSKERNIKESNFINMYSNFVNKLIKKTFYIKINNKNLLNDGNKYKIDE